jgi:hypothetical protein
MKTIFGMMMLLAAASSVACSSAPVGGEESTAAGSQAAAHTEKSKVESVEVESKATPEISTACTLAQKDACAEGNDGYPCGCHIVSGKPVCWPCQ